MRLSHGQIVLRKSVGRLSSKVVIFGDDLVDGHEPLLSLSLAGGGAAALVPAMHFVSNRVRTKEPFRV